MHQRTDPSSLRVLLDAKLRRPVGAARRLPYILSRVIDPLLTTLQSVFTSDISSGVLQRMAVKAGLAITQAKVLARLTATFKRFFE